MSLSKGQKGFLYDARAQSHRTVDDNCFNNTKYFIGVGILQHKLAFPNREL